MKMRISKYIGGKDDKLFFTIFVMILISFVSLSDILPEEMKVNPGNFNNSDLYSVK